MKWLELEAKTELHTWLSKWFGVPPEANILEARVIFVEGQPCEAMVIMQAVDGRVVTHLT